MDGTVGRRELLKAGAAAAATLSVPALAHARAPGSNERISIGFIGSGSRAVEAHMPELHRHDKAMNAELTAFADPWRFRREQAAGMAKQWYGRDPRAFTSYRDLLALDDVDAVLIASPDHLHATHLEAAARAKKDIYVEKPLCKDLESLRRAVDAVKESGVVCQVGTQLRSFQSFTGCREAWKSGVLGTVARIEQTRNADRPYWYYRLDPDKAPPQDVDWKEFLGPLPERPYSPVQFTAWYGYREFSDGPVPGLASHFLDLVHYITGAQFPLSAVCQGGVFTFKDEHRFTCPDHVEATWVYPEGFIVHYSTVFGSAHGSTFKMIGTQATMDMQNWNKPFLTGEGAFKKGPVQGTQPVAPVERPDHWLDWLQCIRSRKQPNAPIEAGYQHAVAAIMAVRAMDTGKRQVYDPGKREIREG